jgi:hypothetical protein
MDKQKQFLELLAAARKATEPWVCYGVVNDEKCHKEGCERCREGILGHAAVGPIPTLGNHKDDYEQAQADLDYMQRAAPRVIMELVVHYFAHRELVSLKPPSELRP